MNNNYSDHNYLTSDCLWSLKDVTKVLLFYFLMAYIGIPVLYHFINYITDTNLASSVGENIILIIFSIFINILASFYIIYIVCSEYKLPLTSLGLTLNNWKQNVFEGIKKYAIAIPLFISAGLISDFIFKLTNSAPHQQEIAKRILEENSTNALILMIIFGTVVAPIVEELIFRGFLQPVLYKHVGRWKSIFLSSFFFRLCTLMRMSFCKFSY